jgi:ABC-2 type transport system permease protein
MSESQPHAVAPRPAATVHDLGYKRYGGSRLAASRRWRVIMRNQIAVAWKGWLRFKAPLAFTLMITVVAGAVMYVSSNRLFNMIASRGTGITFADGIVPFSMMMYTKVAFAFSLSIGASVVASDAQNGAFTFYFSRPVRPIDYVVGKFAGLFVCNLLLLTAGPVLLGIERLGLADKGADILPLLPVVGKALVAGLAGAALYAALPLGFSALANTRGSAIGMWSAYYLIGASILTNIGNKTDTPLGLFDPANLITQLTFELFDVQMRGRPAPLAWPILLAAVACFVFLSLAITYWRVNKSRSAGVGGAS